MTTDVTRREFSDFPLTDITQDKFDRKNFVNKVVELISSYLKYDQSTVFALIGSWGSGKSSILNFITEEFNTKPTQNSANTRPEIIYFNPWYYQDQESLQTGFFAELSATFTKLEWPELRDEIAKVARAIAPIASLGAFFGLDASKALDGFADLVETPQGISDRLRTVESLLRKNGRSILVVIDDIDRLDPSELLLTLKLIRLIGRLPYIHYLLAYDEQTIIDRLQRTGLVSQEEASAIDYLEKIIQIRIDMPPVRKIHLHNELETFITHLAKQYKFELDEDDRSRFNEAYFAFIASRMNTPRALRRYYAQVTAFISDLVGEVNPTDYLLITWIRTFEPLLYRQIQRNKNILTSGSSSLIEAKEKASASRRVENNCWHSILRRAHIPPDRNREIVDIINILFPKFGEGYEEIQSTYNYSNPPIKGISDARYFERYFAFGVPAEEISDLLVINGFEEIGGVVFGDARQQLEDLFSDNGYEILSRAINFIPEDPHRIVNILKWLVDKYECIEKTSALGGVRNVANHYGAKLYDRLSSEQQIILIQHASSVPLGLYYIGGIRRRNDDEQDSCVRNAFVLATQTLLTNQAKCSPLDISVYDRRVLIDCIEIDADATRQWVHEQIDSEKWTLMDFAASFYNFYGSNAVSADSKLGDLHVDHLFALFDLDDLVSKLDITEEDANISLSGDVEISSNTRILATRMTLAQMKYSR